MTFDATERSILAGLADVLIPASESFLSASQAGVAGDGLDQVLAVRPELASQLKAILQRAQGGHPAEVIAELRSRDSASFTVLAELVPGAYFLNSQVRAAIGYNGQTARPIVAEADYRELLQGVIGRGPVYRPTPEENNA